MLQLTNAGILFLGGETANTNMTIGMTINQGTNYDEILTFKSSDITHTLTNVTEEDTYARFLKVNDLYGGLAIQGFTDGTVAFGALGILGAVTANIDTTKSTSGRAAVEIIATQIGSAALANVTTDANCVAFRCYKSSAYATVFIVDEDGDYHYDGADGGAFDEYDDAHLVRAFSLATSRETIKSQFDAALKYNEQSLIEAGILGDTIKNGGLVNGAQLQRLHNGAIWQLYERIRAQEETIRALEDKLKLLEV
jgi:hypothetical protein